MSLVERYNDESRNQWINEWLQTVSEITTETISLAKEGDPLTNWDVERYSIVRYKDGTIKRDLTTRDVPSKIYKHIDSIMQSWGLQLMNVKMDRLNSMITWNGIIYVRMSLNLFHADTFDLSDCVSSSQLAGHKYNWETYNESTIESVILDYMTKRANLSGEIALVREVKIRSLLK
jgi:hypothetical protein